MRKSPPLARLIVNRLAERGLTQEVAAKSIGCDQTTLSRWASGYRPRVQYLRALAEFLGLPVHEVVDLALKGRQ